VKLADPTFRDENDVMDFRSEFLQNGERMPGAAGLENYGCYADWLHQVDQNRDEQTVRPDLPPRSTLLCRDNGQLIAIVSIRHRLADFHMQYTGHIGQCIRPSCRTPERISQTLALALAECRRLGLARVLLTCSRYDAASRKAIEQNGGVLENETAYEGDIRCRYWAMVPAAVCRPLSAGEMNRELFAFFIRRQEVTMCRRRVGLSWRMVYCPFVDDWTEEQLLHQIHHLQTVLHSGGAVFGAFADGVLKGFSAVAGKPLGPDGAYRDLLSLHVSADCRGRGLGRMLFEHCAQWAREDGAQKLYISAHSAQETQAFYAAMGCVDTLWPSPEHVALEPFDCQLEYTL